MTQRRLFAFGQDLGGFDRFARLLRVLVDCPRREVREAGQVDRGAADVLVRRRHPAFRLIVGGKGVAAADPHVPERTVRHVTVEGVPRVAERVGPHRAADRVVVRDRRCGREDRRLVVVLVFPVARVEEQLINRP